MNVSRGGTPGPSAYYVKYRPVFAAAAPGQPISPDLAGRFAADFGLGAQLAAGTGRRAGRASAEHLLSLARGVYAMAKTTRGRPDRHHLPPRLLPGYRVEERHALGRRGDRARR